MKYLLLTLAFITTIPVASAQEEPISRRDAFIILWDAIKRPAEPRNDDFSDVSDDSPGGLEINYARARNILDDESDKFYPDDALTLERALLWLFRTRNVEPINQEDKTGQMEIADPEHIPIILERFPIADYSDPYRLVTKEELESMMQSLDSKLASEVVTISSYGEYFQGKGTAFGETFDMHEMTAASRTLPYNTMVRVTSELTGKSVVVRINDRGPFVWNRYLDLSSAAFSQIISPTAGITKARIERLGDASIVSVCNDGVQQRRINNDLILTHGVPNTFAFGDTVQLSADDFFVVQSIISPNETITYVRDWVGPEESFSFTPTEQGIYRFVLRSPFDLKPIEMAMNVKECNF